VAHLVTDLLTDIIKSAPETGTWDWRATLVVVNRFAGRVHAERSLFVDIGAPNGNGDRESRDIPVSTCVNKLELKFRGLSSNEMGLKNSMIEDLHHSNVQSRQARRERGDCDDAESAVSDTKRLEQSIQYPVSQWQILKLWKVSGRSLESYSVDTV